VSDAASGAASGAVDRALNRAASEVSALQDVLSAENAAVFGYGVVGAHLAGAQRSAALRDWVLHETDRDTVTGMLTSRGAQPVPAAAAYQLPFRVRDAAAAAQLAAYIEDRVTAAYLGLVALTRPALREFSARKMRAAALRAAAWSGRSLAFPGMELPAPHVPAAGHGAGASPAPTHSSAATPPGTS
jgi:uncharacterized protein DUF4439